MLTVKKKFKLKIWFNIERKFKEILRKNNV